MGYNDGLWGWTRDGSSELNNSWLKIYVLLLFYKFRRFRRALEVEMEVEEGQIDRVC